MGPAQFKVGDVVKLKPSVRRISSCPEGRQNNATAAIKALLTDIDGGLHMERDLCGCKFWNVEDVMLAAKGQPRAEQN
jgi:hypothetical protein